MSWHWIAAGQNSKRIAVTEALTGSQLLGILPCCLPKTVLSSSPQGNHH